jgi:serine/threonine protein phosphatase PrpC
MTTLFKAPSYVIVFRYQLTVVPESYPNRQALVTDKPKDGDTKDFYLKDGDLILLGTDGYFDNVYSHETLALINAGTHNMTPEDEQPVIEQLVKALTLAARKLSFDRKRLSPWAKAAQENGNFYRGGKVDDITCILTLVRQK